MIGKCLCGKIEFEAREIPGMVFNCHCSRCRKSHGADYATQVFAVRDSLKFKKGGKEFLKEFSSTGGIRTFCSNCGSRLMNYAQDSGDYLSIAAACLHSGYHGEAVAHCFTAFKASWHVLSETIPAHKEFPDNL